MVTVNNSAENRSDEVLDTATLQRLIQLYEDPDQWPDYFIEKACKTGLSETIKDEIRKNLPYTDDFRRTIKRMANSVPPFRFGVRKGIAKDREKLLVDAANAAAQELHWEGEKTLWAATPSWREFVFLTGDVFVKFPRVENKCVPERMAAQDTKIKSAKGSRKGIDGFRFQYFTGEKGTSLFTAGGVRTDLVIEEVTAKDWTIEESGQKAKVQSLNYGFIPVSHLAWEEREGNARGLPLALRLVRKCLHISAIQYGIRMGAKMNSFPIGVVTNATTGISDLYPGMVLELNSLGNATAAFTLVGGDLDLTALENELQNAKRELAELAMLPFEGQDQGQVTGQVSGKSMERLSAGQVAYRLCYILNEQSFVEDAIYKKLVVNKDAAAKDLKRGDITPLYDAFGEAPSTLLERAKTLFAEGFTQDALRLLGYDEEAILRMVKEAKTNKAEQLSTLFQDQDDDLDDLEPEPGGRKKTKGAPEPEPTAK